MFAQNKGCFNPFAMPGVQTNSELNERTKRFFEKHVDKKKLVRQKMPKADLKHYHIKAFELSLVVTLFLLIIMTQAARNFYLRAPEISQVNIKIEVADIPVTEQLRLPPPPARPTVPVPTEDESIPEDLTIASTELSFSDIPPPPPPTEDGGEPPIFLAYDEPPEIIGGIMALQKYLRYPAMARRAGIEGMVFVKILVGLDGRAEKFEVISAKPLNIGFEEAALEALKKVKWKPAKQRDRNIRCWISIPVKFQFASS